MQEFLPKIITNQVRASLIVVDEPSHISKISSLIQSKEFQNLKICFLDFDIFSEKLKFPFSDNILRISFRLQDDVMISKNNLQLGLNLDTYVITEMHLIYLIERIYLETIKKFNPDLIMVMTSSDFTRNKSKDSCVFSGDCNFFYLFLTCRFELFDRENPKTSYP